MKELKITKRTDPPSIEQVLRMPREREPYSPFLIEISKKKNKLSLAEKAIRWEITRIDAIWALFGKCSEYFLLYEPKVRVNATEEEIEQAKKNLIKARYPKFYEELFEQED